MLSSKPILTHSRFLSSYLRRILNTLLPPPCLFCGAPALDPYHLCGLCRRDLPSLTQHCPRCGQFLTTEMGLICGGCLSSPPPYDRTFALFPYEGVVIKLITGLKFQQQLVYAQTLGSLMAAQIRDAWYHNQPLPDVLLPLPLHPLRLRERGFNQAVEIARPIAKALQIPLDLHGLQRIKHTAAQSGLSAVERMKNMTGAFSAERDYTGLSLAVIDDVMTTGQTMRACCEVLKKHGARWIDVWCCARR